MSAATPAIWPLNMQTLDEFHRMLSTPETPPITEMNDNTARDLNIIWRSIRALEGQWRGNLKMHSPDEPTDRKEHWGIYAKHKVHQILPVLREIIAASDGQGKVAIDLGCGNSPSVPELLKRGWKIIAVDSAPKALDILIRNNQAAYNEGRLQVVEADVTDFTPKEAVDLVIAADILPYTDPAKFQNTWMKISTFVKPGGTFSGSLFRTLPSQSGIALTAINTIKEAGAWLLPDRRMVRPLLAVAGYQVKTCIYRQDLPGDEQMCIQFIAHKPPTL